jgi:hypothetical protein
LGPIIESTKAVDEGTGRAEASAIELLSLSSKSDGKLYYTSSLSSVYSESSSFDESGGEESSDWSFDKSGKLNRPPKVAIIIIEPK